jgi:hypothetical protein
MKECGEFSRGRTRTGNSESELQGFFAPLRMTT